MSELKQSFIAALKAYRQLSSEYNTLIEKDPTAPIQAFEKAVNELAEAKDRVNKAWYEYLHKEILA